MAVHIGTSGWSYDHWQGRLYPPQTPVARRLAYYVQHYNTAELNSSYYHWPRDATFQNWRRRLPADFLLSVKAPRGLTHARRLYGPEIWLQRIQRALDLLGPRRGAFLVQLPPSMGRDDARLAYFLALLPPDWKTAVEFRHPSWLDEAVFALLERYRVAYCVMSGARLPCVLRATAAHVYVRLHGPHPDHLYAGSYSDEDLRWWADRIHEWAGHGHEVFAYFNNDGCGYALQNASTLRAFVGHG